MEPLPAGVPRSATVRVDATCDGVSGQRRCNSHFRTGQRKSTAVLLVLAAQHAASKPRGPTRCRPHGGAPAAATNADAAGANCGWRDARAGRQFPRPPRRPGQRTGPRRLVTLVGRPAAERADGTAPHDTNRAVATFSAGY